MLNEKQDTGWTCFYLEHLDVVRRTGSMNMYGAPRYLIDNFGLSRKKAHDIFKVWTNDIERHLKN